MKIDFIVVGKKGENMVRKIYPVKSAEGGAEQFNRVKVTRLGRGLSTGADLEYADEITLSEALTNRKEL